MINELIEEIKTITNKNKTVLNQEITFIAYLIHLKYLCEENIYSFEEVISNDNLYPLNKEIERIIKYSNNKSVDDITQTFLEYKSENHYYQ